MWMQLEGNDDYVGRGNEDDDDSRNDGDYNDDDEDDDDEVDDDDNCYVSQLVVTYLPVSSMQTMLEIWSL